MHQKDRDPLCFDQSDEGPGQVRLLKGKYASKHFLWTELQCRCGKPCNEEGTGPSRYVQPEALEKLEIMRGILGPLRINSCVRCPIHNQAVRGAPLSMHRGTLYRPSRAIDIRLDYPKEEIIKAAEEAGFRGIGINYRTFVHVDNRNRRVRF